MWRVRIDDRAARELRKLAPEVQTSILSFLRKRIATDEDPRRIGKPLTGVRTGLWRYRVGDYRLVCRIQDEVLVVLLLRVGHRGDVYR